MAPDEHRPVRRPMFLRVPDELRRQLTKEARASERSLTAEVIVRLRASLKPTTDEVTA